MTRLLARSGVFFIACVMVTVATRADDPPPACNGLVPDSASVPECATPSGMKCEDPKNKECTGPYTVPSPPPGDTRFGCKRTQFYDKKTGVTYTVGCYAVMEKFKTLIPGSGDPPQYTEYTAPHEEVCNITFYCGRDNKNQCITLTPGVPSKKPVYSSKSCTETTVAPEENPPGF